MDWKSKQNPDGGWAYASRGGISWTEPTALVLLAQSAIGVDRESYTNGLKFLRSMEVPQGGLRPQPGFPESTWVTALAALLPDDGAAGTSSLIARSVDWLKGQTGRESGWRFRLEQWKNGDHKTYPKGWPWFPGAAAWVIPTCLGILAFERALATKAGSADRTLAERVADGRGYLVNRQCADGGWNHGSNEALGQNGDSYPETTGIGLLAFAGQTKPSAAEKTALGKALAAARKHLTACRTAEGTAWLRMGLAAHGEPVNATFQPVCRTNMDEALMAMTAAPRNPLLTVRHS